MERNVTKPCLIEMVKRQPDKWREPKFSPSKTTTDKLRYNLLTAGFTKAVQGAKDSHEEPQPKKEALNSLPGSPQLEQHELHTAPKDNGQ